MSHKLVTSKQIVDANDKSLMFHFFVFEITNGTIFAQSNLPVHGGIKYVNSPQANYKQVYMQDNSNVTKGYLFRHISGWAYADTKETECFEYRSSDTVLDMYKKIEDKKPNAVNLIAIDTLEDLKQYEIVVEEEWIMVDENTKKRVVKEKEMFTNIYDTTKWANYLVSQMYATPSRDSVQEHDPKYVVVILPVKIN